MSIVLPLISVCSILAPITIGAIYLKSLSFVLRIMFVFVVLAGAMELLATYMTFNGMYNLYLFHINTYLEFTVIAMVFFFSYDSALWRTVSIALLIAFLIFSVLNNVLYESFSGFNTNQRYVEGIMVILLCAGYYISLLRRPVHRYLEQQPVFWLTSGWLIYFAGTLYLFLFSKELLETDNTDWWMIHSVLNIGLNIVYVISFVKGRRL